MEDKSCSHYNLNLILYIRKIAVILSIIAMAILLLYYLTLADGVALFGLVVLFPSILLGLFFIFKLLLLLSKDKNLKTSILITITVILLAYLISMLCLSVGYNIFIHSMNE